jgi:FecR protein
MTYRAFIRSASFALIGLLLVGACPSFADSGHARIVRLSLVQGDVRYASDVKGDSLASQNATWDAAELNLPIRQGYALATDKGRAEVEFENGAMAFLGEDTVIEFFDLSNADGAKSTRLVLRQGTVSFYANPANGDYFSVTGGDFTVASEGRSEFRLDNFDDASTVNVSKGHVSVLRKNKTTEIAKGQSLTMHAGDENSVSIARLPASDDFDHWVSGRIDSTTAATASAQQYTGSSYYTSGLGDLYTYGSWYPVSGFGNCWRPYGVGLGWAPFGAGSWYGDPFFGTSFIGNQPWGWLPYHYGGWIFDPSLGWLWSPGSFFYGGPGYVNSVWSPSTGVFVRSRTGFVGVVPVHPLDARGKTPINLARGVFPVSGGSVGTAIAPVNASDQWKALKNVPTGTVTTAAVSRAAAPQRVSRSVIAGSSTPRAVTLDRNSSITYDAREHRFVNANPTAARATELATASRTGTLATPSGMPTAGAARVTPGVPTRTSVPTAAAATRASVAVPRSAAPPPAPRSATGGASRGSNWGGSASSSGSRGGWTASAPAAASSGASRGSSTSAPSAGGRPH